VIFVDEMRVGLLGQSRRVWGKRGEKVRQRVELYVGALGSGSGSDKEAADVGVVGAGAGRGSGGGFAAVEGAGGSEFGMG